MTAERWQQKLSDFEKAQNRLLEALVDESPNQLEKDGTVQRFEFTFELAWKTLAGHFKEKGYGRVVAPRDVLRQAFQDGLIEDGDLWMAMLDDRNRTTHIYDQDTSDEIFANIRDKYSQALQDLVEKLKAQ